MKKPTTSQGLAKSGLTLIEVDVTVSIIGIVATTVTVPPKNPSRRPGRRE
jgi:prepilin-type N-terminal cleavage/methylation domain-containing protein